MNMDMLLFCDSAVRYYDMDLQYFDAITGLNLGEYIYIEFIVVATRL